MIDKNTMKNIIEKKSAEFRNNYLYLFSSKNQTKIFDVFNNENEIISFNELVCFVTIVQ